MTPACSDSYSVSVQHIPYPLERKYPDFQPQPVQSFFGVPTRSNLRLVEKSVELAASVAAFQQTPPSLPSRERQQQDLG